jgi:aminobenzoyl-glutamate utilization protein B
MKYLLSAILAAATATAQNKVAPEREAAMKADLTGQLDGMKKQAQVMVDSVFSFGELGFQEFETSKYLTGILEKERLQSGARHRRHSYGLRGDVGIR